MDGQDGVVVVVRAREKELELALVDAAVDLLDLPLDIRLQGLVLVGLSQLEQAP